MRITFFNKKKSYSIDAKQQNIFTQFIGLMFSGRKTSIRLFSYLSERKVPIHSWFVFYPFLIVWLDSRNKVIEWKVVKPFTLHVAPKKLCRRFLEIPFDDKYLRVIRFIVGKANI